MGMRVRGGGGGQDERQMVRGRGRGYDAGEDHSGGAGAVQLDSPLASTALKSYWYTHFRMDASQP